MGIARNTVSVKGVGWAEEKGRRECMEDGWAFVDAFGKNPTSAFFAVYDGHGGHDAVVVVCNNLHKYLWKELTNRGCSKPTQMVDNRSEEVVQCLVEAFGKTDELVLDKGVTSGAVACACLVLEDLQDGFPVRRLYTAHVGDARAVIARNWEAVRLTSASDHKATDIGEQQRVIEAGGTISLDRVNGMLAITRAFGNPQMKKPACHADFVSSVPDCTATPLTDIDNVVVVACDGLWDVMCDQEAIDFVFVGIKMMDDDDIAVNDMSLRAEILSTQLIAEAMYRGTTDNVTCMVVFL
eukprot:GEMP01008766.1.p1 GENE.GEMP01008766.1~~GEMP01008766.1.p1  ORF type:complete len:296 (+),score=60.89 GEMP01008766.1:134-1021(+)